MSMNDVNLAPGNTGNPIKGPTQGADTQAVGGGKVAGMSPTCRLWSSPLCGFWTAVSTLGETQMRHPSVGWHTLNTTSLPSSHFYLGSWLIGHGGVDTPSLGGGTGSSGGRRDEELRSKAPQLEEREKVEQGKM